MGDMWQESRERDRVAANVITKSDFVAVDHPYGSVTRKPRWGQEGVAGQPLKAYKVVFGGVEIGIVYQSYESVHRKAGRIITSTRYVLRWSHRHDGTFPSAREYMHHYSTRKAAAEAMVERMLVEGCTVQGTKLVAAKKARV